MLNDQEDFERYFIDQTLIEKFLQICTVKHYKRDEVIQDVVFLISGQVNAKIDYSKQQELRCLSDCIARSITRDQFQALNRERTQYIRSTMQFLNTIPLLSNINQIEFSVRVIRRGLCIKEGTPATHTLIIVKGDFLLRQSGIEVSSISRGEVFGELESLKKMNYQYSLSCQSDKGEVIVIKSNALQKVIPLTDPHFAKLLLDKLVYRSQRLKKLQTMKDPPVLQDISHRMNSQTICQNNYQKKSFMPIPPLNEECKKKVLIKMGMFRARAQSNHY